MYMKTFNDLNFAKHRSGDGIRAFMLFENGFGISVIKTKFSYGGAYGMYELAVTNAEENLVHGNPILEDDISGWLNEQDVTNIMKKMQEYHL